MDIFCATKIFFYTIIGDSNDLVENSVYEM